jgi:exodeoxyribonuclease VII small subunit
MGDAIQEPTFEETVLELEKIVRALEDGKTGLEEALTQYEKGVALLNKCYRRLKQAEQRILELTGVDDKGNPELRPFAHTATTSKGEVKES